jgi:hypothetical protein
VLGPTDERCSSRYPLFEPRHPCTQRAVDHRKTPAFDPQFLRADESVMCRACGPMVNASLTEEADARLLEESIARLDALLELGFGG